MFGYELFVLCILALLISSTYWCNDCSQSLKCADFNECHSTPCQNGATCINGQNEYTCDCTAIWTGLRCEMCKFSLAMFHKTIAILRYLSSWCIIH